MKFDHLFDCPIEDVHGPPTIGRRAAQQRLSNAHPMAVGSEVEVGRVGWVSYILWIAVCYQGYLITRRVS